MTTKKEEYYIELLKEVLGAIEPKSQREGVAETPARYWKALREMTAGYNTDPMTLVKTFEDGAEGYDEMITVRDLPFYSLCEHHLLPFFGKATISYIPNGRVVGLSKLGRVLAAYSQRLQVQERLTSQIADLIHSALDPLGVGVVLEARHLCMEARGLRASGSTTITTAIRGVMRENGSARTEMLMAAYGYQPGRG